MDRRDRKPHLNRAVLELLCSGVGFRQAARVLPLTRRCLTNKWRKVAQHVARLEALQLRRVRVEGFLCRSGHTVRLQMDEFETYEGRRSTRPLSIPTVIDELSRFRYAAIPATIRPRGPMPEARLRAIATEERRFGPRVDGSRAACSAALLIAAEAHPRARHLVIRTDRKSTYPGLIRDAFRGWQIEHNRHSGAAPRGHGTPLHPINLTEEILRDHLGRLRRKSWLVSKDRGHLELHLRLINAFRNWVRPRFNFDTMTPAQVAAFTPWRMTLGQLLGWAQVWGDLSPCPFRGCTHRAVEPIC